MDPHNAPVPLRATTGELDSVAGRFIRQMAHKTDAACRSGFDLTLVLVAHDGRKLLSEPEITPAATQPVERHVAGLLELLHSADTRSSFSCASGDIRFRVASPRPESVRNAVMCFSEDRQASLRDVRSVRICCSDASSAGNAGTGAADETWRSAG